MRGPDTHQETLFSAVIPEERVPADHPLRPIREMVDKALERLDDDFAALNVEHGRPSIPPEKLLRAQLLMALYTIRSDRQLVEQIDYNLLFRWFVGFSMDDEVWNHSTFSKNRDRLLEGDIARRFFPKCEPRPKRRACCRKSISAWTAHCWKRWPRTRAIARRTNRSRRVVGAEAAIPRWISGARSARATRMNRRPTRTLCCSRKARGRRRSCRTWAMP